MPLSVYLAGPDVFLPDAARIFKDKKSACAEFGFIGASPFDNELDRDAGEGLPDFSRRIYDANVAMMRASDFGVFDLTPFRGPSADAGTAFELGMMTALGKPVFGYTSIAGDYADRVAPRQQVKSPDGTAKWVDENGWSVEGFGNADNLMLDGSLARNGAMMVRYDAPMAERFGSLAGFRSCLALARDHFAGRP